MAQTVIGMFDSYSQAQIAVEKLVSSGISRDNIDISNSGGSSYNSTATDTDDDHDGNAFTRFFKNLFSDDDDNDNADRYSHVASRSESVVTVHAQTRSDAENAADILDDNGAIDVDERASQYGYAGSSTGSTGSNTTGSTGSNTTGSNWGNTHNTVGAFDTGTDEGVSGTASSATGATDAGTGLLGGYGTAGTGFTTGDTTADTTGLGATGSTTGIGSTGTTGFGNTGTTTGSFDNDDDVDTTGSTYRNTGRLSDNDDQNSSIPVIEENLEVGKREVESGRVRLRSRIVERPVEESLRLREERVNVERNPVDRAANAADLASFEDREIELVEHREVPVVNKQARVVEEVSLNKDVQERNETISDTVRRTEIDVDDNTDDTTTLRGSNSSNSSSI